MYEKIKIKMEKVGMTLLWSEEEFDEKYKNNRVTQIPYLGKCGHQHTGTWASISNKIRNKHYNCPICSYGHEQRIEESYNEETNEQRCYECEEWKNRDECYAFEKERHRRVCKDCRNSHIKQSRENWTEERFMKNMVDKAKRRHKKEKYKGDFNITVEDIVKLKEKQNNKCKLTGNELIWQCYQDPFYMVSLDRIDSSKTYMKDNIQLVCWFYNTTKGKSSDDDMIKLARLITENINKASI